MEPLRLNGPERLLLRDALRTVFTRKRFDELLLYRLDRQLDDFAGPDVEYPTVVRKVIEEANAGPWWREAVGHTLA